MNRSHILIVEDDERLVDMLALHFERNGWTCDSSPSAEDALERMTSDTYDLIVLDRNLPGMDGLSFCKKIRALHNSTMILMLTAYSDELDLVVGLESGADDYVGKPFKLAELIARIKALLRRLEHHGTAKSDEGVSFGPLSLNADKREVRLADETIRLTAKEFDVLWFLAQQPSRVFSRSQILSAVWESDLDCYENSINTIVKRIRRKLAQQGADYSFIETVRGVGYRFVAEHAD